MILVFHADYHRASAADCSKLMLGARSGSDLSLYASLASQGLYYLAAEIDTENMDYAFLHTNTINAAWFRQHPKTVKPVMKARKAHRSTSVGDILLADGKAFLVDNVGFTPLPEVRLLTDAAPAESDEPATA